ncbi:hypothetical protein F5ESL0233_00205 [Lactobacillus sp. ESL0233]|uniref:hypothetical protein n=1 Tax=Lactobacillus sp. ESL0233 TaxID=2069354 RepID=UPI000EFBA48C|nr:hypothetical protein [Lactobacillus sp. ESL0233]RMC43319.1 hypothetical protein F5ESL0233_00205 [Lactobacillus sp. ESL0233]
MKFNKIFSDQLDHCYAIMRLQALNRDFIIVASEENQPCYAYDLNNNFNKSTVWSDIGGTMTMVQIPGTLNFLATQKFYPGFNSLHCRIVKETFNGQGWDQSVVGEFPYIHRFDIIPKTKDDYWYIGCSIANSKKNTNDWSDPGKVWVGIYKDKPQKITALKALPIRITKNHGYQRMAGYSLITGEEGIFRLDYPTKVDDWQLQQLSSIATSDIVATDLNDDGQLEYLAIDGFHGSYLRMYDSNFHTLARTTKETHFGHALWGGGIKDHNYFLFGWRSGAQGLKLIKNVDLTGDLLASHLGPSNVLVYQKEQQQYLLSANREANEVAIYQICDK